MTKSVLLVGVGGQGIILAAKILSSGLLRAGYDVKMSEVHGMSQRGGAVSSHVRYGAAVYSPVIEKPAFKDGAFEKGGADMLISFEQMETLRWINYLKPNGIAVINSRVILPSGVLRGAFSYPSDIISRVSAYAQTHAINAASKTANLRGENIVVIGAAVRLLGLEDIDWKDVIADNVKPEFAEMNYKAFIEGGSLCRI
jgi:indolepyruvate ferredoxin oxidoreductase beta subunit